MKIIQKLRSKLNMKKISFLILLILFSQLFLPFLVSSQEKESQNKLEKEVPKRGGFKPFIYSLCLGPRIGLEYNEGRKVRTTESICWLPIFGWALHFINAVDAGKGKTMTEVVAEEGLDE